MDTTSLPGVVVSCLEVNDLGVMDYAGSDDGADSDVVENAFTEGGVGFQDDRALFTAQLSNPRPPPPLQNGSTDKAILLLMGTQTTRSRI